MATERTKSALNSFFETGDFPTQQQFQDFIASYENLVDGNLLVGNQVNITAFAGGGKTNATQLTKKINNVSVVGSINDSVKLPVALAGRICYVADSTLNRIDVYTNGTDTINNNLSTDPIQVDANNARIFVCCQDGIWQSYIPG